MNHDQLYVQSGSDLFCKLSLFGSVLGHSASEFQHVSPCSGHSEDSVGAISAFCSHC